MIVGLVVVGLVLVKEVMNVVLHGLFLSGDEVLITVSGGLAIAATLELAYTLFTKGPDEAVGPLILGLAAATLLAITFLNKPGLIMVLVIALALSFMVRDLFITDPRKRKLFRFSQGGIGGETSRNHVRFNDERGGGSSP